MQQEERARRIVDSAVELAEQGGFEAVRLRDVAAHAGVALGTLYRRFRSKEDLLVAARLDAEVERRQKPHRIFDDPGDVLVLGEDKGVRARGVTFTRNSQHRRFAVQDGIGLVPVFLGAFAKQVHVCQGDRAFHGRRS